MIDVTGEVGVPEDEELSTTAEALGFSEESRSAQADSNLPTTPASRAHPVAPLSAVPAGSEPGTEGTVLGTGTPKPAKPLKTSIDPAIQDAAVTALAGRAGGVVAMAARTGAVKAIAGQAYSVLQPPGSTMKIVTATVSLDTAKARMDSTYPVVTEAPADGRTIQNAHGELCGGTFVESFANLQLGLRTAGDGDRRRGDDRDGRGLRFQQAARPLQRGGQYDRGRTTHPDHAHTGQLQQRTRRQRHRSGNRPGDAAVDGQRGPGHRQWGGVVSPTPIAVEKDLQSDREPIRVTSKKTAAQVGELMVAVVTRAPVSRPRSPRDRSPERPAPPK